MVINKWMSCGNSRNVRFPTFDGNIAKCGKYMDPILTSKENNVDKAKEFFKVAGSFHFVTFNGLCQKLHYNCPLFYHERACEHTALFSLLSEGSFER